ncbi:ROK family protein [Streptomyces sp. NPDC004609]|uniref:ROK family transcriptional regulator n=1 Tax=Streptomyces sp. NPDC004609 TaxID=3364704 RepID=UPI00367AB7E2
MRPLKQRGCQSASEGENGGVNRGLGASATGADLPALRGHNAALVLDLLRLGADGGISRLELADRTGLTPQAVSKITARLRAEGLAAEAGHRASTGGKPRTVLRLVPSAGHAVGLHLDRDELTVVLLDLAGTPVAVRVAPLDLGAGGAAVVEAAAREVEALLPALAGAGEHDPGDVASGAGPREPDGSAGPGRAGSVPVRPAPVRPTPARTDPGRTVPGREAPARPSSARSAPVRTVPATDARAGPTPREAAGALRVLGIGVAMPGPLDHTSGVTRRVTGFPAWDGYPLRDAVAARLGLPAVLDKDTNAAALALALAAGKGSPGPEQAQGDPRSEARTRDRGRGRGGGDSFAYLHLGSGLGAGLVLGGGLHRGPRTGAGEFGHQVVQLDGPECVCGRRGCVEALCLAAVGRGDLATAARILGVGAANLVALLDIDRVLLGGRTVDAAGAVFVREVGARAGVPVALADGGPHLVAGGAAQLVLAPLFGRDVPPER